MRIIKILHNFALKNNIFSQINVNVVIKYYKLNKKGNI